MEIRISKGISGEIAVLVDGERVKCPHLTRALFRVAVAMSSRGEWEGKLSLVVGGEAHHRPSLGQVCTGLEPRVFEGEELLREARAAFITFDPQVNTCGVRWRDERHRDLRAIRGLVGRAGALAPCSEDPLKGVCQCGKGRRKGGVKVG